jgi:hypothetical protein
MKLVKNVPLLLALMFPALASATPLVSGQWKAEFYTAKGDLMFDAGVCFQGDNTWHMTTQSYSAGKWNLVGNNIRIHGGNVNSNGTYTVNISQTVASTTISAYYERPLSINSAFVRVNTNSNGQPILNGGLDYPITILNLENYEMIGLKTLNGPWPRALYYQPSEALGTIFVWPNPSQGEMHIFADTLFQRFTTINDEIVIPQGYLMALRWCLAERLMPMYGKASPTQIQMINGFANHAKATIKRNNMKPMQVARFEDSLIVGKRADAGWILTGGF